MGSRAILLDEDTLSLVARNANMKPAQGPLGRHGLLAQLPSDRHSSHRFADLFK
jgi:hypothetical protein